MLPEEATWIGGQLALLGVGRSSPLLNLGSGNRRFREEEQPFIGHLWRTFENEGGKVLHADLRAEPGVDLVGDLTDPNFQSRLRKTSPKALLVSNLLEHVPDVGAAARLVADLVPPRAHLIVTGPMVFPYHPDPLDNGLRATPEQAAALFPGFKVVAKAVVDSPTFHAPLADRLRRMGPWRRLVRSAYWTKEALKRRRSEPVRWVLRKHNDRMPQAFAIVLRKEA